MQSMEAGLRVRASCFSIPGHFGAIGGIEQSLPGAVLLRERFGGRGIERSRFSKT
jgi:hypothetical protein